jgi:hypothetical protein
MRGLQLANRWVSRPGEPFAGLSKCSRGEGQKEVSCAGQRAPTRTARAALGGVSAVSVSADTPGSPPSVVWEHMDAFLLHKFMVDS